jgi:hypothetical protein
MALWVLTGFLTLTPDLSRVFGRGPPGAPMRGAGTGNLVAQSQKRKLFQMAPWEDGDPHLIPHHHIGTPGPHTQPT